MGGLDRTDSNEFGGFGVDSNESRGCSGSA